MKKSIWIGLILCTATSFAQENLVENGSFEDTDGKVKKLGSLNSATGWTSPTAAKPDLYTASKVPEVNVPQNLYGSEEPKSGGNYAGVVGFSYGDKVPRSYIQTRLSEPLKKGEKYCIQYSISLAEGSKYAIEGMGAMISKKEYGTEAKSSLIEEETSIVTSKMFSATFDWDKVCGIYIAEGGERFLTIGNFRSNEDTKNEKNKTPKGVTAEAIIAAYYYIDDVSVVQLLDNAQCDCATSDPTEEYSKLIYQKQVVVDDKKMTAAEKLNAQELYFAFGSNELTPLARDVLNTIAELMKANPTMKIQILSHSDKVEDEVGEKKIEFADMTNKRLSAVIEYLTAVGVSESRLLPVPKGNGIDNPEIRSYDDEEMIQAKNRRVTFKVQ